MKKILFAANLDSFFTKFLIPQLKCFKEMGYEVHVASKSENINIPYCDKKFDVNFARGFNLKQNIESYKQMKEMFKNEHYDIVSCHTPFGGAITRLAFKACKIKNTKMVYMAHGFHFYKGASLLNWLLFYSAERYLAKYTDALITINLEDYEIAKAKFKTNVYYVKGIGLDPAKFDFKFTDKERNRLRKSLGLNKDDFVMIYPAEILPRKRQKWLINTLKPLLDNNKNFKVLLPGKDSMNGKCQELVKKLNLENQIKFLGFRKDVPQLIMMSDLSISTSKQEGLPVNIMEGIYCGLPIVATACRGNRDLIENGKNGFIVGINDKEEFCKKILYCSKSKDKEFYNIKQCNEKLIKEFLLDKIIKDIVKIYEDDCDIFLQEPKRILQVISGPQIGGVETMLMNIYRHVDRKKIQFDFTNHIDDFSGYYDEINALGGKVHQILPIRRIGVFKYINNIRKLVKNNKYQIVHSHISINNCFVLFGAWLGGAKIRISHAHTTSTEKPNNFIYNLITRIMKKINLIFATDFCACGKLAGEFLYGKKMLKNNRVKIINNAIDIEKFTAYHNTQKSVRKSEKLPLNKTIVGHIGRFDGEVKNHKFIIDLALYLKEKKLIKNYYFILVGTGENIEKYKEMVIKNKLQDNFLFYGLSNDIPKLMQAFDYFILPSLYEGLPVVAIESQAAGVKTIVSNKITREIDLKLGLIEFLGIERKDLKKWANILKNNDQQPIDYNKILTKFEKSNYNIKNNVKKIYELYNIE